MQRRVALLASVFLALAFVAVIPFSSRPLNPIPAFTTFIISPMVVANLVIAYLLFSQFLSTGVLPLALLAVSYLYTCLILIPYILFYPGIFPISHFIGATTQIAGWFWIFWHTGFPAGILLYVLVTKFAHIGHLPPHQARIWLIALVTSVVVVVIGITALLVSFPSLLPSNVNPSGTYINLFTTGVYPLVWGTSILAYLAVLLFGRKGTLLQVWLQVVALIVLLDVILSFLSSSRYSLGWYISRLSSLIETVVLLCALLYEVNHLYGELMRQNDELVRQHAIQNNFISVVSHEFRTALTSIQGFSEIMLNEDFSTEEAREFAGDMNSDAHRLSRLITEMLDLDRMRSGTMKLVLEQLSMNMLIEEVVTRMRATTSRHLIRTQLDPTVPMLWGDHDKLIQVLSNLLNNAIKYSPDGGEIMVKNWREKDTLHISVRDHGMGIPPEQLEQVFERYARVESTRSRYVSGTGLGLPIVRQIVQMHGGKVWAESAPDEGTVFHLTLPLVRTPVPAAARSA